MMAGHRLIVGAIASRKTWLRPALEACAMLGVLLAVDAAYFSGDRFAEAAIHPFGAVVLLISVQYGLLPGVIAAAASSAALHLGVPPKAPAGGDFYDAVSAALALPATWAGLAIVVGGLRNLQISREKESDERRQAAEGNARELAEALERSVAEIRQLELQVAADTATMDALVQGMAMLDTASVQDYAASARSLIADLGGASAFTIYAFAQLDWRAVAHHDEDGRPMQARKPWATREDLARHFASDPAPIDASHPEARKLLPQGALMIAPIGDVGFLLLERMRAGQSPRVDRIRALADTLARMWPRAGRIPEKREGVAA